MVLKGRKFKLLLLYCFFTNTKIDLLCYRADLITGTQFLIKPSQILQTTLLKYAPNTVSLGQPMLTRMQTQAI